MGDRETIKEILIRRDEMTPDEADELILEAKEAMNECIADDDMSSAYCICSDYFGLEPDYLDELLYA